MKEYLRGKGRMGDTYADVILREIDRADQYEAAYLALTWDCRDCHVLKEHLCAIGGEMLATVCSPGCRACSMRRRWRRTPG
jgi:hypothetical protein